MELRHWMKGFLFQAALATVVFVLLASGLERLIPGFVEPFLNLPMFLFFAFFLLLGASAFSFGEHSVSSKIGTVFFAGIGFGVAGSFLWTRLANGGSSGIALMITGILAGALVLYTLFTSRES